MADIKQLRQLAAQQTLAQAPMRGKRPEDADEQLAQTQEAAQPGPQPADTVEGDPVQAQVESAAHEAAAAPTEAAAGGPSLTMIGAGALGLVGLAAAAAGGGGGGKSGDSNPPVAEVPKPVMPEPELPKPVDPKPINPTPIDPKPVDPAQPETTSPTPTPPDETSQPTTPDTSPEPSKPDPVTPPPSSEDPPAPLRASLAHDSGKSASDGYTNDATLNISGFSTGARWQYRLDGEEEWKDGVGNQIANQAFVGDGVKTVHLREIDQAGNVVNTGETTFELDRTAPSNPDGFVMRTKVVDGKDYVRLESRLQTDGEFQFSNAAGYSGALNESWHEYKWQGAVFYLKTFDLAGNGSKARVISNAYKSFNVEGDLVLDLGGGTVAARTYSLDGGNSWKDLVGNKIPAFELSLEDGERQVLIKEKSHFFDGVLISEINYSVDVKLPVIALARDSGGSSADGITNDGTVTVRNLYADATWKYRLDGTTWKTGDADHIILASEFGFTEGHKQVQAVQVNAAGKESAVSTFDFTLEYNRVEGGTSGGWSGTSGMDRFIVKPTDGSRIFIKDLHPEQGDVIDISSVLTIPAGADVTNYIGNIGGTEGKYFFVNPTGGPITTDQALQIAFPPFADPNAHVTVIYNGGQVVL